MLTLPWQMHELQQGYAQHRKLDCQDVSFPAVRIIAGRAMGRINAAIGKSSGIKFRRFFSCAIVPKTDYVFGHIDVSGLFKLL